MFPTCGGESLLALDPRSRRVLEAQLWELHCDPQSPVLGLEGSSLMTPSHETSFFSLFPLPPILCTVWWCSYLGPGGHSPKCLLETEEKNVGEKSLNSGYPTQFSEHPLHMPAKLWLIIPHWNNDNLQGYMVYGSWNRTIVDHGLYGKMHSEIKAINLVTHI